MQLGVFCESDGPVVGVGGSVWGGGGGAVLQEWRPGVRGHAAWGAVLRE